MHVERTNTETIVDDNGIEIVVTYTKEKSAPQPEEGHGQHEVGKLVNIELLRVSLVIEAGREIELLPLLHPGEKEYIMQLLNK